MYHLHCATCGCFLVAITDKEQARGVYYCPEHTAVSAAAKAGDTAHLPTQGQAVPDFHQLLPGIGVEIMAALAAAGYDGLDKIQAASDADLLAISGIGRGRLRQIREVLK